MRLENFWNLFSSSERDEIDRAAKESLRKHPTWYPLFANEPDKSHWELETAVRRIQNEGQQDWLDKKKNHGLMDVIEPSNASSAMAEIRVFGGLLRAGYELRPLPEAGNSTPDFIIESHGGPIEVEVAAKHENRSEGLIQERINEALRGRGEFPEESDHEELRTAHAHIQKIGSEYFPGSRPDPDKRDDSSQTNLISKVCGIKQCENQICGHKPAILAIDFTAFGDRFGVPDVLHKQTSNLISGSYGITSGALWYAFYGWKNAPVFEEGTYRIVRMLHEGRFRASGENNSKLSGALLLLPARAVFFENPWAGHELPNDARFQLCNYPYFDLAGSLCDWYEGMLKRVVEIQRGTICAFEKKLDEMFTAGS